MALSSEDRRYWSTLVYWLKRNFPAAYPVTVRTCRTQKGEHAATVFKKHPTRHFVIYISEASDFETRVSSLLHEWPHALVWAYRHDRLETDFHDESWGVYYAKVYSAWEREFK